MAIQYYCYECTNSMNLYTGLHGNVQISEQIMALVSLVVSLSECHAAHFVISCWGLEIVHVILGCYIILAMCQLYHRNEQIMDT